MKKKLLAAAIAASLALMTMLPAWAADPAGETKQITDAAGLAAAIAAQEDGQTWELAASTYVLTEELMQQYASITINGEDNFVFPITANNLTIKGADGVLITSDYEPGAVMGGVWSNQNFITVAGSGVTIENVDLKANYNAYNDADGGVNKAIEIMNKDFTMKAVNFLPVDNKVADDKESTGSIIFNTSDLGNSTLEEVTFSGWLTAGYDNRWGSKDQKGTLNVKNSTVDFTNHVYEGDAGTQFVYDPEFIKADNFVMVVNNNTDIANQVLSCAPAGTVVKLAEDIELDHQLYIYQNENNITIDGAGNTITASADFGPDQAPPANPEQLINVEDSKITFKDITIKTTDKNTHALNVYGSEVTFLGEVTLDHTTAIKGAPLVNNGSTVTVDCKLNLVTGEKSWYGINVDNKSGPASMVFEEGSAVTLEDKSGNDLKVLQVDTSNKEEAAPEIKNPENAGLVANEDGTYREEVKVTGVTLDASEKEIKVGESFTLKAEIAPENADNKTLTWTSSNNKVATVDANGKVTAVAAGTATITVKAGDATATCEVTVAAATVNQNPDKEDNEDTGVADYMMLFAILAMVSAGAVVLTVKKTGNR